MLGEIIDNRQSFGHDAAHLEKPVHHSFGLEDFHGAKSWKVSFVYPDSMTFIRYFDQNNYQLHGTVTDVTDARGDPTAATRIAEQALVLLEQAGATHDLRYPDLLGHIADYYKKAGDTHKGFDYVERALAAAERDGLGDTDAAMTAVHNVVSSLFGFGELKEGCSREARLVDRLESTGRRVIPAIAVLHGTCLLRAGDAAAALVWYDKGLSAAVAEQDGDLEAYAHFSRGRALIALQPFRRGCCGARPRRVALQRGQY